MFRQDSKRYVKVIQRQTSVWETGKCDSDADDPKWLQNTGKSESVADLPTRLQETFQSDQAE